MELKKDQKNEEMDLGYKVPAKGDYVWQFTEGVELHKNEESGKKSIRIPLQVIEVIDGDEEAIMGKASLWPSTESSYGEKQILGILTMTGLIDSAIKSFGEDINPEDEKFIRFLSLKLPGKLVCARHTVTKSKSKRNPDQDIENVNFVKMWKHGKKAATPGAGASEKANGKSSGSQEEFPD